MEGVRFTMAFYSTFAHYYDQIFPFREKTYTFLKGFLPAATGRVLDIGCGTGKYAGQFARDGLQAVGIDRDPAMIAWAKEHHPEAAFFDMDMNSVAQLQPHFDLIFSIGNVMAHLPRRYFERVVQAIHHLLTPAGVWIFQVKNWDVVLKAEDYAFPVIESDVPPLRFYRKYEAISSSRITFVTRLEAGDDAVFEDSVELYPMKSKAYMHCHEQARFRLLGHYSDFAGHAYRAGEDKANILVYQRLDDVPDEVSVDKN